MPEAPLAPRTVDDVTPEWLDTVLRYQGVLHEARIVDLRSEPVSGASGFLAETVELQPTYDRSEPSAPTKIIAKLASPLESTREFMFQRGLYRLEVLFYSEIAPLCEVSTPRCLFSGYDPDARRVCVLVEHLSQMRQGDELTDTSLEELETAIEAMALLHATFWDGRHTHDLSAVPTSSGVKPAGNTEDWRALPDDFHELIPEPARRLGDRLCSEYKNVARYVLTEPLTLNHGDFRLDNVFFGAGPATLIDWQTISRCRPSFDLGWFFGFGLHVDRRREYEERLIRHYHGRLMAHGVRHYDFDACWRDYRVGLVNGFWRNVGAQALLIGGGARGHEIRRAGVQRMGAAVTDHGAERLLDELASS